MDFYQAVEAFKEKYGSYSDTARALGWTPRKYRHLRKRYAEGVRSDSFRLLVELAKQEFGEEA